MNSPLFCYTPEYKPKLSSHFQTPLHLALRENNLEIIEILLAFGADPAVRDRRGNNAFHMAAVTGDAEVMRAIARSARKRGGPRDSRRARYRSLQDRTKEMILTSPYGKKMGERVPIGNTSRKQLLTVD